eukprot:TRINITY_DN33702_c0_g1_i1.p1 TRINITY_DN33702_c0_g1~~TRINITY_DN33702_c0_g1_i1.p1  ORF type:complete len:265 (+),score=35.42 TRINITY_DN33702_c0_g1_i1:47-841(+)
MGRYRSRSRSRGRRDRSRSRSRDRRDRTRSKDRSRDRRDRSRSRRDRREASGRRNREPTLDRMLREKTGEENWTEGERAAVQLTDQDRHYIEEGLPTTKFHPRYNEFSNLWDWSDVKKLRKALEFGLDGDEESRKCEIIRTGERVVGMIIVFGMMERAGKDGLAIVYVPDFGEVFATESQIGMTLRVGLPLELEIVSQGNHHTCDNVKVLYRTPFSVTQFGTCPGVEPPPFSPDTAPKAGEPKYARIKAATTAEAPEPSDDGAI